MSKPVVISARIDEATAALLDQVAAAQGRSRAWLVAAAVKRMAEAEAAYLAFVQEGIDAADRGELIPHEDVQAWIAEKRRELMKRKVDKVA
ncbi:MAG: ribbon-helix-helix protein, CopG family [Sphingopyxis sp.]